jgi:hypothetical protein
VRVLFTGQYWPGANTLYIGWAFEQCGAIVRWLNDTTLWPGWTGVKGRIARRLLRPLIEAEWNRQLLELVANFRPDLVYITNATFCWPRTLETIRKQSIPLMCFYHDVLWRDWPGSRFSENISYFDLVATTRHWQEAEFKAAGARAVCIVRFGYEPLVHRPMDVEPMAFERYGADVTFIGTYEAHRAAELTWLVEADFPYQFRLWGGYWDRLPPDSPVRKYWQGRLIHDQEIPVIYAASKVALHWVGWEPHGKDPALRKGDQHNSRTFQIAACGGAMMLAQRTDEHRRFFTEDVEAVYFDDVRELREKLAYWLDPARDEARKRIAAAARVRCLAEDYSYVPVVRSFLEHFGLPIVT